MTGCFHLNLATDLSVSSGYCQGSFHIAGAFWGESLPINTMCDSFPSENLTWSMSIVGEYGTEL